MMTSFYKNYTKQSIQYKAKKIYIYSSKIIEIQLFIALFSWPILISWALPISIVSIISTALFTPLLLIFMLLSLIIFISQTLHIPNNSLIYILEHVSSIWLYLLKKIYNQGGYLLYFIKPSYFILISISILSCICVSKKHSLLLLSMLALFIVSHNYYLHYFTCNSSILSDSNTNTSLKIIKYYTKNIIIDNGILNKRSCKSFINYNLIPELIRLTGKKYINTLVIQEFKKYTFSNIKQLLDKVSINSIYIPISTNSKNTTKIISLCKIHNITLHNSENF